MRVLFFLGLGFLLGGCTASGTQELVVEPEPVVASAPPINPLENPAAELALWMEGYFSSAAQADADADYAEITLRVTPIWPGREDGPWFYIEQAEASTPDDPYRQRVYRLRALGPGEVASEVYALPRNGQDFVGAWQRSIPLVELTPDDLDFRDGCTVFLERQPNRTYAGGTRGQTCVSRLRGASYATSTVTIGQEGMTSWDQGFNNAGRQVWGAENGPYRFDRIED